MDDFHQEDLHLVRGDFPATLIFQGVFFHICSQSFDVDSRKMGLNGEGYTCTPCSNRYITKPPQNHEEIIFLPP